MPNEPWGHVVYWTYCHFFGPQFEGKTQNWRTVLRAFLASDTHPGNDQFRAALEVKKRLKLV